MTRPLLDLPPELLIEILGFVPIRTLLKFSECSQYAQSLAKISLHSLHLDFASAPRSYRTSAYIALRHMPSINPSNVTRQFFQNLQAIRLAKFPQTILGGEKEGGTVRNESLHRVTVRITDAHIYEYSTLVDLHSALASNILKRYHHALQNLEISVWVLTIPTAEAISQLPALRSLSIKVEDYICPSTFWESSTSDEREAWAILGRSSTWDGRLRALKIDNAVLTVLDLAKILGKNKQCREIGLKGCKSIDATLWYFLGNESQSWTALQVLILANCGGTLNIASLKAIEKLKGLQHLDLRKCFGLDPETVEYWNKTIWHIPTLVAPKARNPPALDILEVDSDYTSDN
ncbi:hypothetical protein GQ44DRAFT_773517 [Phaeosphaeriaceae sp. PMI808]|nr:hypothetical protein GQ44DRAFT_773517 [Phaeosphaeriaceae sp. PMI808]